MTNTIKPLIAGNWKMNGLIRSLDEIQSLKKMVSDDVNCNIVLCLPSTLVYAGVKAVEGSSIRIGGQDCHTKKSGAHTGDISAEMLADVGADYVIVGHSERRTDHGETDAIVSAKTEAAISARLIPIICVGETEEERRSGKALEVVHRQIAGSVPDACSAHSFAIAYEPVWAIGTGLTPTTGDIEEVHGAIREQLTSRFGEQGRVTPILYGGSMKPSNAGQIMAVENVNGGLVGGASLKAADFIEIIRSA